MDTVRTEYTEAQRRAALKRMQSALQAARRAAPASRNSTVRPASRREAQPDDTYEAGMFQECGLLA